MIRSVVVGCGSYLPERILTNADLEKLVDTSDEWIIERTGIHQRHIAADNEKTSDLALNAARAALADAGVAVDEVDLIVLATSPPDQPFPATACQLPAGLDRQTVWQGKRASVRCNIGGWRCINKKKTRHNIFD